MRFTVAEGELLLSHAPATYSSPCFYSHGWRLAGDISTVLPLPFLDTATVVLKSAVCILRYIGQNSVLLWLPPVLICCPVARRRWISQAVSAVTVIIGPATEDHQTRVGVCGSEARQLCHGTVPPDAASEACQ